MLAKKRAKKIAEERIKKKTKFNEKMKVYFSTYKLTPSTTDTKSSTIVSQSKEKTQQTKQPQLDPEPHQQQTPEEPIENNPLIGTFDSKKTESNSQTTENDVDTDLKKAQSIKAESLANQFHEFIESKEDFVYKQKQDENVPKSTENLKQQNLETNLPTLKTNDPDVNGTEKNAPQHFEPAIENKIESKFLFVLIKKKFFFLKISQLRLGVATSSIRFESWQFCREQCTTNNWSTNSRPNSSTQNKSVFKQIKNRKTAVLSKDKNAIARKKTEHSVVNRQKSGLFAA